MARRLDAADAELGMLRKSDADHTLERNFLSRALRDERRFSTMRADLESIVQHNAVEHQRLSEAPGHVHVLAARVRNELTESLVTLMGS